LSFRGRLCVAALAALALAALAAPAAEAHGLVGRTDLPVPSWLFGWAAAIVLLASFAALSLLWSKPQLQDERGRRLLGLPRWVDPVVGAVGIAAFAVVVYSGFAGTEQATANLAPTTIYVLFWVGFVVVSVLLGDVFRPLNPWRATARAVAWAAERTTGRRPRARLPYPSSLGRWPAAVGILVFAWVELAYINKDDPDILVGLALAYAVFQLGAMAVFGIENWSRNGDAFGVYFGLFGRLSPLERREDGGLYLRPPLSGAPRLPVVAGTVGLLVVAIGSTTFDGFSNGPVWSDASPHIQDFFTGLGIGDRSAVQWANTVGLVGCVLAIGLFYRLGVRGMQTVGEGHDARELAGRFVHTLIPIAFAYALAHYFSLLVFQGQAVGYLISDPLGHGSDLFGTADASIDYNVVSTNTIWYVQVGALITGHVAGLTLAHDRAVALYRKVQDATRSQYWMLVVMVGFTSLGLWLLSAVNQ
jgi:hypothetical protein